MVRQPADSGEPGKVRAALLTLLVHAVFLALLVFGLNWKNEVPETMTVDLWTDLPQSQPVKPSLPAEKIIPKSEPVKTKPQPQPQPAIKVAPPPVRKPEIALKEETEKPLPQEDVKKTEPVREETPKAESDKKVEQKREKENDARQKAEAQQRAHQQAQEMAAAKAEQARMMDEIAKYKAMIQAKIRSRIIMPPDLPGNPVAEFRVTLLPGGDVLAVTLRKSSGYTVFDEAVERAVFLAKPLPLPPDPGLFREFRNFSLTVYYRE